MRILFAVFLTLLAAAPTLADATRESGAATVIARQLEAFQSDDLEAAFGFASPAIRGIFGSPERFGTMVQRGYPMVWRPGVVRFLALREEQGRLFQRVMITDRAGAVHLLDYHMVEQGGRLLINGVQLLRGVGAGA